MRKAAASVRRVRNQDWAGSAAAGRCQAIKTVFAKSIGKGVIAIAALVAICSATRRGTIAIKSEPSAAGTAGIRVLRAHREFRAFDVFDIRSNAVDDASCGLP